MKKIEKSQKHRNNVLLCVIFILAFSCKTYAMYDGNICDAFNGGIKNSFAVSDQVLIVLGYAQDILLRETTIEEQQYLDDVGYSEEHVSNDPISRGEIDLRNLYNAQQADEMNKALADEAQRAWEEYNEPQPDITDRIIKP